MTNFSFYNILQPYLAYLSPKPNYGDITEERMEEYRMMSAFQPYEIVHLKDVFNAAASNADELTKEEFLNIKCIAINPLKDRIALCFGYDTKPSLNFSDFLVGVSGFNAPGRRDQKLKLAFKIHDFDDDGEISKNDVKAYLELVTKNGLTEEETEEIATLVLTECLGESPTAGVPYSDFHKIVAKLDFQAKLHIDFFRS